MTHLSVGTVVINEQGLVLLMKRKDFQVWSLPGGSVESGESIAQAAMREVLEETGIEVALTRLVGLYSQLDWPDSNHRALFAAVPVGGTLRPQPEEALEVGYFPPDALPEPFLWWHRQQLQDALSGVSGAVWMQNPVWPFQRDQEREQIYAERDRGVYQLEPIHALWCHPLQPEDQYREL